MGVSIWRLGVYDYQVSVALNGLDLWIRNSDFGFLCRLVVAGGWRTHGVFTSVRNALGGRLGLYSARISGFTEFRR